MQSRRPPLVSVVTPSFNQGRFIERTLRSVLCQKYPNIEYVVVDALSSDNTAGVLDRYGSRIDLVIRERDAGLADALHKGFARCRGDILAYLNSDDCYANSGVIERVVACFEQRPEAEVLFGRRIVVDEEGQFISRWPFVPFDAATLTRVDFIPQECCFWRRSVWERTGSFIDRELRFAVDYELWLRFLDSGARFLAIDEPFGLFREHGGQKSQTRWLEEGWPEVHRLQANHGVATSEADLQIAFDRHIFGTGLNRWLRRTWHARGDRQMRRAVGSQPLDAWSRGQPMNARDPSLSA